MLQKAYFLAKIGADTAENERIFFRNSAKIWQLPYGSTTLRPEGYPAHDGSSAGRRRRPATTRRLSVPLRAVLQNFANFWRARWRLYQNEILQKNMRLTAFFKLYKSCILLHRFNLKISFQIGKTSVSKINIFREYSAFFFKCCKI